MEQLAEMPDKTRYFSIARTVTNHVGGHSAPPQEFALAVGCDVSHAGQIVYADGLDLKGPATPIGTNCRLCERLDCGQRAFPPINHRLMVDDHKRGRTPFYFAPAGSGPVSAPANK